jgi:hypothetical protein
MYKPMNPMKSEKFPNTPHDICLFELAIGVYIIDERSMVAAAKQKLEDNVGEEIGEEVGVEVGK